MSEEWGPWIEHDGKGCPLPVGIMCEAEGECGARTFRQVSFIRHDTKRRPTKPDCYNPWFWDTLSTDDRFWNAVVVRYRTRKAKGLVVCEDILADVEATPSREEELA